LIDHTAKTCIFITKQHVIYLYNYLKVITINSCKIINTCELSKQNIDSFNILVEFDTHLKYYMT